MKLKIIKVCTLNSRREMGLSKKCCVVYVELVPSAKSSFPAFSRAKVHLRQHSVSNKPFLQGEKSNLTADLCTGAKLNAQRY